MNLPHVAKTYNGKHKAQIEWKRSHHIQLVRKVVILGLYDAKNHKRNDVDHWDDEVLPKVMPEGPVVLPPLGNVE